MFIGDVLEAFDNVNPLLMSLPMNETGAHSHLNAAILEEHLSAEVRFEDLTVTHPYNSHLAPLAVAECLRVRLQEVSARIS